jgi:hypothetical protein
MKHVAIWFYVIPGSAVDKEPLSFQGLDTELKTYTLKHGMFFPPKKSSLFLINPKRVHWFPTNIVTNYQRRFILS